MTHLDIAFFFFFFNDTATTEIYTLSLHDALPISLYDYGAEIAIAGHDHEYERFAPQTPDGHLDTVRGIRAFVVGDRKSTRLNSSHSQISYAVFCLKKKKS